MDEIKEIFGSVLKDKNTRSEDNQDIGAVKAQLSDGSVFSASDRSDEDKTAEKEDVLENTEPMSRLASFVTEQFRINVDHRRTTKIEEKLKRALLSHLCEYDDSKSNKLIAAGLDPLLFSPLTAIKNRAAKAMLVDICNSAEDPPWKMEPSPDPDVADDVSEEVEIEAEIEIKKLFQSLEQMGVTDIDEDKMKLLEILISKMVSSRKDEVFNRKNVVARIRAKRMEKKVHDIMVEGGWIDAFADFIDNLCIFGTGIIIGPIERNVAKPSYKKNDKGGFVFDISNKCIPVYESISPLDCYPAPNSKKVDDGPLCIRVTYTSDELWRFSESADKYYVKDGKGWISDTVRKLLERYPSGGVHINEEQEDVKKREVENHGNEDPNDCTMEGIRCFASIRGSILLDFGITKTPNKEIIKDGKYYRVEVIVIAGFVVYCKIIDDRFGIPISKGKFYELPGSWWGESICDKLYLIQKTQNNVVKALFQNMAVASGPMFWISDVSRLADKSPGALKFAALKMIPFKNSIMGGTQGPPMGVLQVSSNANELLAVWDKMRIEADDASGIPAYTYGQSSGQGALRTASGLAMFSEAASRGMKMVITTLDRLIIRKVVKKTADWVLLNDDDMSLKGDVDVYPAGIMGKVLKAQQDQQRLQLLQMVINNQGLSQMVGPKGIMALLRPSIQDVNINPDDVLPSESKVAEMELLQKIQQLFQATAQVNSAEAGIAAANGISDEGANGNPGVPGVPPPENPSPPIQGGVAERHSVA